MANELMDEYVTELESEVGDVGYDPHLGEKFLFWFTTEIELGGETFSISCNFNLSNDGVTPEKGEIWINESDPRMEILDEKTRQDDAHQGSLLYTYYPEREEIEDAVRLTESLYSEIY